MVVRRSLGDLREAYRPFHIEELYGQPNVAKTIGNWLSENSVPNMILLAGPQGTGKVSTAKIIAMRLICTNLSNGKPCFDCPECNAVSRGYSISKCIVYTPSEYKDLSKMMDDIKYGSACIHHNRDGEKILVFDEFHMIGHDAQRWLFGQFIKYPNNKFVVCSSNPTEILEDIRKRLIALEFGKVNTSTMQDYVKDVCADLIIDSKQNAVSAIIEKANGSPEQVLNRLQDKRCLKKLNPIVSGEIKCIPGKGRLLLVAPHAVPGDENDDFTGAIARKIQQEENCYAIVNEKFSRNEVDLNNLDSIDAKPKLRLKERFLDPIRSFKDEIKKQGLEPLIVYIHGIKDKNILKWGNEDSKILIGYGQGIEKDKKRPDRPTLGPSEIETIKEALSHFDLGGVLTPVKSKYCARKECNLNQLFQQKRYKGFYDPTVRSVQFEIKKSGMREDPLQAVEAGIKIDRALREYFKKLEKKKTEKENQQIAKSESAKKPKSQPAENQETKLLSQNEKTLNEKSETDKVPALREPRLKSVNVSKDANKAQNGLEIDFDEKLVSETYEYLHEVVQPHFHTAMLAAGTHIIEKFFDGDFERARNPRNATKIHSFNELTRRLQGTDGHGPSKTWVYNAIKLAVDEKQFEGFSVYGKLGLSHKVYLTHVKNLDAKRQLIQEAVKNNYTVARTRERIAEVQGHDPHETISYDIIPSDDDLEKMGRDELLRRKKVVLSRFDFYKNKMEHFQKYQDSITKALKSIASRRNAPFDHSNVIGLPPKEATKSEQQHQKRERGVI